MRRSWKRPIGKDAEDRSAGRHEEREREGVDERAEVERVAQKAVGASCDDLIACMAASLHDGGAEVGRAPGAERRRDESAEDAEEQHSDGRSAEADSQPLRGRPCGEELPGADGVQMQPVVPRGGEAKDVDDGVDEEAEAEFEGDSFHCGAAGSL